MPIPAHHPFTMPHPDDREILEHGSPEDLLGVRSLAYDLVKRFLGASFRGEGRYLARLEKVEELERLVDG